MRRVILALGAALTMMTGADASILSDFEAALAHLDLEDDQAKSNQSAVIAYHHQTDLLLAEKSRQTAALLSSRAPSSVDQMSAIIRLEAYLLTSFVTFRTKVRATLSQDQHRVLDALLLRLRNTLAEQRHLEKSVAF